MKTQPLQPFAKPVVATVSVPGSKSYTNRALLLAAMTPGSVHIKQPLLSDDTAAMIHCLRSLGLNIIKHTDSLEVANDVTCIADKDYTLDVNLSGLTLRFLLALCAVIPGMQTLHGKPSLNKRPIADLVDGLRQLGAHIEYLEHEGMPPVRISSSTLTPGTVHMQGDVSSQYFSALLQVAPLVHGDLTVQVDGQQISKPYIDMTIDTMQTFGVRVTNNDYHSYTVAAGQQYAASQYTVEGDVSSAAYFWAIATLTSSTITVTNLNPQSKQADMHFLEILKKMGSTVTLNTSSITVAGQGVRAVQVDMENCPDQAMTLATLAAFAPGTTVMRGIRSLRVKETERVVALQTELQKMGISTSSSHDTLSITGGAPQPAAIDTYGDHRIAMSFAVAGTTLPGMVINDPVVVNKTFPGFWKKLAALTHKPVTQPDNIVLIGMRGSGKNTVGKLLAKHLGKAFVDMDALIVQKAGMSVPQMVNTHGWDYFRDLEARIAKEVALLHNTVIATGGGVVLRPANMAALQTYGTTVLLKAQIETLVSRIQDSMDRPALTTHASLHDELAEVWRKRQYMYHNNAKYAVTTDARKPTAIADDILQKLMQTQA